MEQFIYLDTMRSKEGGRMWTFTSGRALRIWREDAAALQAAWDALG